jgi:hypothetical protein
VYSGVSDAVSLPPFLVNGRYIQSIMRIAQIALYLTLLWMVQGLAHAQVIPVYDVLSRPPGVSYQELRHGSWRVIFQEGVRDQAEELLWTLDGTFAAVDSLVGDGQPPALTVVLNDYNDRGNGYVTSFPFKSEIESTAISGRGLSPRNSNWTRLVTTHELVHAVQADASHGFGLGAVVRPFAPDLARSMNMWMPKGWLEGLAVLHESAFEPGGGRLNHPFFTMQFRAGMDAGWSLAEMLEPPSYHRPFNRFYLGGALYSEFFVETYGVEAVQKASDWQGRIPFMGFGTVSRLATGDWPDDQMDRMRVWYDSTYGKRTSTYPEKAMVMGRTGLVHRNPQWLNDSTVLVYAFAYNLARGLFTVDVETGERNRLTVQETTEDAVFSVDDAGIIHYSRYERNPTSAITWTSRSFSVDPEGETSEHPGSDHTLNPVRLPDGTIWAIRTRGAFSDIVSLGDHPQVLFSLPRVRMERMAPRPHSDSVAVIAHVGGHQGLFMVSNGQFRPWIGFRNASIYDASWSADGKWLLFTADLPGTLQVHALRLEDDRIFQVTDDVYAAMEPSFSPDGQRLAYVVYRDERFDLVVDGVEPGGWRDLGTVAVLTDWPDDVLENAAQFNSPYAHIPSRPYSTVRNLSFRSVFPVLYPGVERDREGDARLGIGAGVGFHGTDILQRMSWYGEAFVQNGRPWGTVGASTSAGPLFPTVRFSRRPETVQALDNQGRTRRAIRDRLSASAGIVVPWLFQQNVSQSSLRVGIFVSRRNDRILDDDLRPITSSFSRWSFTPSASLSWRVLQNPRDIMPSSGTVLRWIGEFDLEAERFSRRKAWISRLDQYVPLGSRTNTGIRLTTGLLHQNVASVFNLDGFRPRGWEDGSPSATAVCGQRIRHATRLRKDGLPVRFHGTAP